MSQQQVDSETGSPNVLLETNMSEMSGTIDFARDIEVSSAPRQRRFPTLGRDAICDEHELRVFDFLEQHSDGLSEREIYPRVKMSRFIWRSARDSLEKAGYIRRYTASRLQIWRSQSHFAKGGEVLPILRKDVSVAILAALAKSIGGKPRALTRIQLCKITNASTYMCKDAIVTLLKNDAICTKENAVGVMYYMLSAHKDVTLPACESKQAGMSAALDVVRASAERVISTDDVLQSLPKLMDINYRECARLLKCLNQRGEVYIEQQGKWLYYGDMKKCRPPAKRYRRRTANELKMLEALRPASGGLCTADMTRIPIESHSWTRVRDSLLRLGYIRGSIERGKQAYFITDKGTEVLAYEQSIVAQSIASTEVSDGSEEDSSYDA